MILGIIQARFSSSRFPGKVLQPIAGRPMLTRVIERAQQAKSVDRWLVATTTDPADDAVAHLAELSGLPCYRGSVHDVLDRYYKAAEKEGCDAIVRVTADCPLLDPDVLDSVVHRYQAEPFDYVSNVLPPTYPDGLDVELVSFRALERAWREAKLPEEREHVTMFIHRHANEFRTAVVQSEKDLSSLRWTVDHPEDLALAESIYLRLAGRPAFRMSDVLEILDKNPELKEANQMFKRNEAIEAPEQRYRQSTEFLKRAESVVPLGSQTFSKSRVHYPLGVSPLFMRRGLGSRVWDIDGNEYLDFNGSLCSVSLGYNDPDVTIAVQEQLRDGVIFPLPHPLETEVAELICDLVPCAEKVRFGKNGSDATAGAVRLARAYTGRDHVAICGYHGWQDWYIGSTARNRGVPKSTIELTHAFQYNKLDSLAAIFSAHPGQVAAVILEPMNVQEPDAGFLLAIKEMAQKHGSVLIFDETITGFRFAKGGAQEFFGVTPDLATFGKGLANGYPVSAVAGRADIMQLMEEIFFSFTFGGECLSLAAAKATLIKLKREPVNETMSLRGAVIKKGVSNRIAAHGLQAALSISGHPTWSFLNFKDVGSLSALHIKTLFLQEIFARGVLSLGTHNIMYAHSEEDGQRLLNTYDIVFSILATAIGEGDLTPFLKAKPLEPLFKVR